MGHPARRRRSAAVREGLQSLLPSVISPPVVAVEPLIASGLLRAMQHCASPPKRLLLEGCDRAANGGRECCASSRAVANWVPLETLGSQVRRAIDASTLEGASKGWSHMSSEPGGDVSLNRARLQASAASSKRARRPRLVRASGIGHRAALAYRMWRRTLLSSIWPTIFF